LSIPDDIPVETLREFYAEADDVVEALLLGFSSLDTQRAQGGIEPKTLNDVFRHAHSLKGLAGMFAFDQISALAHEMETLLDALRLGKTQLSESGMRLLYDVGDAFRQALSDIRNYGKGEKPDVLAPMIERVQVALSEASTGAHPENIGHAIDENMLGVLTEYEEHRLNEHLKKGEPVYGVNAPLAIETFEEALTNLTTTLNALGEVITTLPSSSNSGKGIDFEMIFSSVADYGEVKEKIESLSKDYTLRRLDKSQETPKEAMASLNAVSDEDVGELGSLRQISETVRVDIRKLDELMGIVGELVIARGGLQRISDELKSEIGFNGLAVDLHRLTRTLERRIVDLQGAIMHVRMVPLGQIFSRLSRVIRRVASDLKKQVDIHILGEETELDKLIVEELVDPLMHLVRNSIDHGIESPEARVASGKPAAGQIFLKASPRGSHVVIDIEDDGAGIDESAVKKSALEKGFISEEQKNTLTSREVWNLTFHPGLSTRREADANSGRGVGLDVVKHNISQLSGLIELDSEAGKGSRFTITLPTTLAIIQALILKVADSKYALPLASVLEILSITDADFCSIEGREMLQIREQTFPVMRLDDIFELKAKADANVVRGAYAAVVGLAQHRIALILDDVVGQQDIVVKSLGAYLNNVRGVAGATHQGDNETILVLDVGALIEETIERSETYPIFMGGLK